MLTSTDVYEKLYSSSFIFESINYPSSLKQTTQLTDSFSTYITTTITSHTASRMYSYLELYATQSTAFTLPPESDVRPSKRLTSLISLSTLQPTTTFSQLSDIISSNIDKQTTIQTHIKSNFIASSMDISASKTVHFEASELDITTNSHFLLFVNSSTMFSSKPLQSVTSTPVMYTSTMVPPKSFLHASEDISLIPAAEPSLHTSLYTTLAANKFSSRDVKSILVSLTTFEQYRTSTLKDLFESTPSSTEHPTISVHASEDISWIPAAEPSLHTLLYTTLAANKFSSRDVKFILVSLTTSEQYRTSTLKDLFESTSSSTEHPTIKTTPSFEITIPEDKKHNDTAFPYWVIAIIVVIILIAMTTLYILYRHYVRKRTRKKEFGSITSMDMVHPDIVPKKTKPKYNGGIIETSSFNTLQHYH
ncbi:uncharacterized protein LOC127713086 isoform X2 [Mytilus californianus]|nr:uncharacterized protein LOC127713086 isoform X2 [Mytilus californianus]XP_052075647.1 uncharacterized protein LOC127713086 isoform X2 [Mytilus californianus]XP_052075648.1 uncharacterized protein LOC127713086 isoform X2 [Mytilus californianus]XP_052075649.1 uncharacterized protein LOC127713086 isoform X2 [Mytilus californianus]